MRVVAGTAGGIPLILPPSPVRPTMDRVREAVFSMLGERVPGAKVLDLFAGCGSLGIEALSRGAASAVFVDESGACAGVVRRNLTKSGLAGEVLAIPVGQFLRTAVAPDGGFDLIFADPPYAKRSEDKDWAATLLAAEQLPGLMSSDGLLVLETFHNWQPPDARHWVLRRAKKYGETGISIFSPGA